MNGPDFDLFGPGLELANAFIKEIADDCSKRLVVLREALQHRFGDSSADRSPADKVGCALAAVYAQSVFMKAAILHGQNWPDLCIIEVYAILEHYSKRYLPPLIEAFCSRNARPPCLNPKIEDQIPKAREGLDKLARYGKAINIWDDDQARFMERLKYLRDGFAHKLLPKLEKKWRKNSLINQKQLSIAETSDIESLILFPTQIQSPELEKDTDSAQLICDALSVFVSLLMASASSTPGCDADTTI